MAYQSTYQAASLVSQTIEVHFNKYLEQALKDGEPDLADAPKAKDIEAIIDASFWSSLRKEEGHSPKISLAFLSPEQAGNPIIFGQPLALTPAILTKLAPGVERAGVHLGIWKKDNELFIWGTTLKIPNFCFVIDVSEPGLLVIKHRRMYGLGKFTNVAVLKGDNVKIIDEESSKLPESPDILKSLLGFSSSSSKSHPINVFIQLSVSMRSHGRGGCILIVPSENASWKSSIVQPMLYSIEPHFSGLSDLISQENTNVSQIFWQSALSKEVENIAGLTAIDGSTIMTDKLELLAFGVKTTRSRGSSVIEKVSLSEPVINAEPLLVYPGRIGGTRHLSAAQFVHDQPGTIALVASQDGHFTIFSWSKEKQLVLAHRIDSLLL